MVGGGRSSGCRALQQHWPMSSLRWRREADEGGIFQEVHPAGRGREGMRAERGGEAALNQPLGVEGELR